MKYLSDVPKPFDIEDMGSDAFRYFILYQGSAKWIRDNEKDARKLVRQMNDLLNKFNGRKGIYLGNGYSLRFDPSNFKGIEYDSEFDRPYELFKAEGYYQSHNYKSVAEAKRAYARLTGTELPVTKKPVKVSLWKQIFG